MVLKLLPALPEDALQITYLFWDAMYPEDPFICMIYPQGPVPEAMEHVYKENYPYFSDPIYKQFKIVDTDIEPNENGDEIMAWARWRIWEGGELAQTHKPGEPFAMNSEESNGKVSFDQDFFTRYMENLRSWVAQHFIDKRHMHLHFLCTRPQHQRRGAATLLLNWGRDYADAEDFDIWAAASPMILASGGASNWGFEPVQSFNLEPRDVEKAKLKGMKWPLRKMLMRRRPHTWL